MRKCIPIFAAGAMLAASVLSGDSLRVLGDAYPRAFFFRSAEGMASNPKSNYEQWDKTFSRLMGIEGKALDEEVPGRSARNIDFFTKFKQRHPDQLVLLHFNGNARDPRYEAKEFFAGHWIYYNGAKILSDLPASGGEIDVRVDAPTLFRINIGRYRNANEDIGICELDASGRPDWNRSEQVKLVSVNAAMKTIRVQRGQYGSAPRAFAAGKAYAAAHVSEGPWGKRLQPALALQLLDRQPARRKGTRVRRGVGRRFGAALSSPAATSPHSTGWSSTCCGIASRPNARDAARTPTPMARSTPASLTE